jgi:hypothetical protein
MKKYVYLSLISIIFFAINLQVYASAPQISTQEKIELIKDIKSVLLSIEENNQMSLLSRVNNFDILTLIEAAYADGGFDCFNGGWPNTLKHVGGKAYCPSPKKSPLYFQGNCDQNQIACSPILFGGDVCVNYETKSDKHHPFANCEKKFKEKPESERYNFAKNIAGDKDNQLKNYLEAVSQICNKDPHELKVQANLCKIINDKIQRYYGNKSVSKKTQNNSPKIEQAKNNDCADCSLKPSPKVETGNLAKLTKELENIKDAEDPIKAKYEALKKDYIESGMCNPINNYVGDEKATLLINAVSKKSDQFYPWFDYDYSPDKLQNSFEELRANLNLSEEQKADIDGEYAKLKDMNYHLNESDMISKYRLREPYFEQGKKLAAKFKQAALSNMQKYPNTGEKLILSQMAEKKIAKLDENGNLDCQFINYDAFEKAYKGYSKLKSSLKKPYLTIVDYTQPSNSRRMYTLDMNKNMVLNNTWVAHGSGVNADQDQGSDGFGSSPEVSNTPNSKLSSPGFIKTGENYSGQFGLSIRLDGIDSNNGNLRSGRAIVIHPWGSMPMSNYDKEDTVEKISSIKNIDWNDKKSIERAANSFNRIPSSDFIPSTWGCLGVTANKVPDRLKGGTVSQIDFLRREISGGTLIFNYSGPEQKSKYY